VPDRVTRIAPAYAQRTWGVTAARERGQAQEKSVGKAEHAADIALIPTFGDGDKSRCRPHAMQTAHTETGDIDRPVFCGDTERIPWLQRSAAATR
jgi:hypothetical protein